MLHKIEGISLISLRSPSPSPSVLPYCFIQDILPNPPSPLSFILIETHELLIGMWCVPSTAVPASFVFLCACSAESYAAAAAPAIVSLAQKKVFFGCGGSKDIRNRLQKARGAFWRLWRVWAARGIGRRTKICL